MVSKKLLITVLSTMAIGIAAAPVFAGMSAPMGWYVEGNGGSSSMTGKHYPGSASSSGIGASASLGYKFMPYVAAEVEYTQYANTSVKTGIGTKAGTEKHYSYGLVGKGILPIYTTGIEAFAKLGIAKINSKMSVNNQIAAGTLGLSSSNHTAVGAYFGGGLQYYLMPELAVNVQWERSNGNSNTGTGSLLSAGASFIMG